MKLLIVYIVQWFENGESNERWFSTEHLAYDFARQVGSRVVEKDVS